MIDVFEVADRLVTRVNSRFPEELDAWLRRS
jgi:hypothetical protein